MLAASRAVSLACCCRAHHPLLLLGAATPNARASAGLCYNLCAACICAAGTDSCRAPHHTLSGTRSCCCCC